ncbi:hypothetical protein [Mucilaginibacter antarcticus]|uniref:Aspartyl protease n=1 Tax=Mucilaginibacter antarcticus TaxID=1855725 RepID=A0ABW5XT98_9SPHI
MRKNYPGYLKLTTLFLLFLFAASCKKDTQSSPTPNPVAEVKNFAVLGMYQQATNGFKRLYMAVPKIGDVTTVNYGLVFDTGSTGLTIDANGILPASMITANGFQFSGDSINVSGITITSQQAIISYGGVDGSIDEYGNLAYAKVTIGDGRGNVTTPRIPIFLYYKIIDNTGKQLPAHSADVFGVGPGVSYTSRNIGSPLSYFQLGANVTNGFRLAKLNANNFLSNATFTDNLLYIGLTPADRNGSGFIMHPLNYNAISGYSANITSTVTYGGNTVAASILFDTGSPAITLIQNQNAPSNSVALDAGTTVGLTTSSGFKYQYTVDANNLTTVQKPSFSRDSRTIYTINFFIENQFLLDYTNHQIGLKN